MWHFHVLWVWLYFYWESILFQGMGIGFKNKTVLHCFSEVKCHQGYIPRIWFQECFRITTSNNWHWSSGEDWIGLRRSKFAFRKGWTLICFFNSDILNFVLKTDGDTDRRPYFVIFAFWSALIISGWGVLNRNRKSYLMPAEIASFLSWFYSRMEYVGWVQDFIICFWC